MTHFVVIRVCVSAW